MTTQDWTTDTAPRFAATLVRAHHALLADLARDRYPSAGRGLVTVTFRGSPPNDVPTIAELRFGYMAIDEYCKRTASLTGQGRVMSDAVIERADRYDPTREMVIVAVIGHQFLTTSLTVALDLPAFVSEADGVH